MKYLDLAASIVAMVCVVIIVGWVLSEAVNAIVFETAHNQAKNRVYVTEFQKRVYADSLRQGLSHEEAVLRAVYDDMARGGK